MGDRLPDDIARCHDVECPLRLRCRRWLDRLYGGPRTPHVDTFRTADECERFLDSGSRT